MIARDGVQPTWASYSGTLTQLAFESRAAELFEPLQIPVHLVAGDRDAVPHGPTIERLERLKDQIAVHIWPGGHDLPLTDP